MPTEPDISVSSAEAEAFARRLGLNWISPQDTARLREAPVGHFYGVITNGFGAMYSYAARIEPADRWRIAAYIRVLQLSRNATISDVPADQRAKLLQLVSTLDQPGASHNAATIALEMLRPSPAIATDEKQ